MTVPGPASPESPTCPTCHAVLVLGAVDQANVWSCPSGHGVACTITAAYGRVQDDEIHKIWQGSEKAAAGIRACPMCGKPMVEVAVGVDADEANEGDAGDQADAATVTVDVCREDEVLWLDAGELDALPRDIPAPKPSDEDVRNLGLVRQTFDAGIDEGIREDATSGLLNRLAGLISGRNPAARGVLNNPADGFGGGQKPADGPATATPQSDAPPGAEGSV